MNEMNSAGIRKTSFWANLSNYILGYWIFSLFIFTMFGAFDSQFYTPNYFSAKNGVSILSINGLSIILTILLFGLAVTITSLQMLDNNNKLFWGQKIKLFIFMAAITINLVILGQLFMKANKASHIEKTIQIANEIALNSNNIKELKIAYLNDFKEYKSIEVEWLIENVEIEINSATNNKYFKRP